MLIINNIHYNSLQTYPHTYEREREKDAIHYNNMQYTALHNYTHPHTFIHSATALSMPNRTPGSR